MKAATLIVGLLLAGIAMVAFGQQLTPVATASEFPTWAIVVIVLILVAVGVVVWLRRKDPAEYAKLVAALSSVHDRFDTLVASLDRNTTATSANTAANAPAAIISAPVDVKTEPTAIGKNGVPGSLTLAITGDPAKDVPAFNAAYFGAAQ